VNACIFAGPTLPSQEDEGVLDATWLPPAKHGDVYRAVSLLRPRAIGIVDGYFQWAPSVWHKEILWAIHQGVHVFGAASMGALRAAELWSFGMRGVGLIFEAYRDGVLSRCGNEPFEDDDEVAVVHGPPETGYIAASEAMVNMRCTLAAAETAGVIAAATRARLVALAKALFFPVRGYELLLERGRAAALPEDELAALRAWLPAGRVNQKREDALAMLNTMRTFLAADPAPARAGFFFEHTTLWDRAVAELLPAAAHDAEEARALDELRLDGARFRELRQEVVHSLLERSGENTALARASGEPHETEQRLKELERREALRRAGEELPKVLVERQMLARIRESGEYAKLLKRAQDKQALLGERTDLPQVDEFSELQLLQLRDWYFSRLPGGDMPDDLQRYLRDAGYADMMRFHKAIFAEYVYEQMSGGGVAAEDRSPVSAQEGTR
jgi:hypothetical protein